MNSGNAADLRVVGDEVGALKFKTISEQIIDRFDQMLSDHNRSFRSAIRDHAYSAAQYSKEVHEEPLTLSGARFHSREYYHPEPGRVSSFAESKKPRPIY